jgi:sigma-B regulation protein RsbU (phosphoserine phosphatase)
MEPAGLPGAEDLYLSASCGLALADGSGTLLVVNDTLCSWLECDRAQLLAGKRFQDLLTIGGRIFWQTHLQPLLRMQSSVAEVKLEMARQHSGPLPVMVNIAERAWQGRGLLHVAVFVAEDRHRYERELLLQRRRAEELAAQHARDQEQISEARGQAEDRAKFAEQLVGVVSHDIRNPLSVIQMSAVLLDRGVSGEQQAQVVARITRAVRGMQHLISDLLDFSQARLGRGLSVKKRSCDLQQAIGDAVAQLAVAFPDAKLRHERSGDAPVQADPDRIAQAVGNLVANAVNHGARGEAVTVRTEASDAGFRVTVHNHGQPIPDHVLPTLFEPMVRGPTGGGSKGVGLGLFIVREIVRRHGGEVSVRSGVTGTEFTLALPAE